MTKRKNSFKELEKLEMEEVSMRKDVIKKGIDSDIGIMRYFSSILELFFPKLLDLVISLFGDKPIGSKGSDNNKK